MSEFDVMLFEAYMQGSHFTEIAKDFGLPLDEVLDAISRVHMHMIGVDRRV